MPCLCGDTACPSCGPAQGYDPKYEAALEAIISAMTAEVFAAPGNPSGVGCAERLGVANIPDEALVAIADWHLKQLVALRDKERAEFTKFLVAHVDPETRTVTGINGTKQVTIQPILTGDFAKDILRQVIFRWVRRCE